ncbi:hypothetical protein [Mycobacterium sp. DL592]|uniref:hypothetical protein n=1 Tax=Mycobacterium sp. DL592 TaxID=2675524 RepID=UPI00142364E2|nr:hypothetical protein [Mycobacterium sp. DL592]
MTSVEQVRSALTSPESRVCIAGVPWPLYKLVAVGAGLLVLAVVGAVTTSAAPAVLTAAAVATVIWLTFGARRHPRT